MVGARGVWGCRNAKLWRELGLPAILKKNMIMSTLYGSLRCYSYFMCGSAISPVGDD